MSSLPVGDVGLVVPVLPALQGVDVCVHTGLATSHRTRHGETRGSGGQAGAAGRVSHWAVLRWSSGTSWMLAGCRGQIRKNGFADCVGGVKWERGRRKLASLCGQAERNKGVGGWVRSGDGDGREPGLPTGDRRSRSPPSSAPRSDCQQQQQQQQRRCRWSPEVIVQLRLHTGTGRHRGVEVEKKRTPEKATEEEEERGSVI